MSPAAASGPLPGVFTVVCSEVGVDVGSLTAGLTTVLLGALAAGLEPATELPAVSADGEALEHAARVSRPASATAGRARRSIGRRYRRRRSRRVRRACEPWQHRRVESAASEVERAVRRAARLLRAALAGTSAAERRRQRRLGRIVDDPAARELVQRLTDEVLRITDDVTAARRFRRLVAGHAVPGAFGSTDRMMLRAGSG